MKLMLYKLDICIEFTSIVIVNILFCLDYMTCSNFTDLYDLRQEFALEDRKKLLFQKVFEMVEKGQM